MREIQVSTLTDVVERLCIEANTHLPGDVRCAIEGCRAVEDGSIAKGILDDIIEICDANNLNFILIGGSAIGALRSGGISPWDDDIDIAMPRSDFEMFCRVVREKYTEKYREENKLAIKAALSGEKERRDH